MGRKLALYLKLCVDEFVYSHLRISERELVWTIQLVISKSRATSICVLTIIQTLCASVGHDHCGDVNHFNVTEHRFFECEIVIGGT